MTKDTFREALLVTARVTAIAGCTPAVAPVAAVAPVDVTDGGTLASATRPPPDPPPKPACRNDVDCCDQLVKGELDGGGWTLPNDPETLRCCDVLLADAEKDWKGAGNIWACCSKGSAMKTHQRFCSPWGPPMPPSIVWLDDMVACRSYEWRDCHVAARISA